MPRSTSGHFRASGVAIAVVFGLTGCTTPEPTQQRASDTTVIALDDSQLGGIRGGFDVAPNLSVTFGFQQITAVNHQVVANVIVPDFTFSPASRSGTDPFGASSTFGGLTGNAGSPNQGMGGNNPGSLASGNSVTGGSTNTPPANASGLAANSLQNAFNTPNTSSGGGKSSSVAPVVVPTVLTGVNAGQSATTAVGTQNQGVTTVMTSLGGGGLTNVVGNTANNALVQQVTTINLAISGLQQLLSQHVNSALLTNALMQSRLLPH
jgi:hypothetical protein